jgi:DNA-binding CsgD family transcriptional regulator
MGRPRQDDRQLTPRQREVLRLIGEGYSNAEIAERLGISLAGAKWHVSELLTRLDAASREDLAERWRSGRSLRRRLFAWLPALPPLKLLAAGGATLGVAAASAVIVVVALGNRDHARLVPAPTADIFFPVTRVPTPRTSVPASPTPTARASAALPQPELTFIGDDHGLPRWAEPGADLTQTILVLLDDPQGPLLLIDPANGLIRAKITVGYGPWGLVRHSTTELLLSFGTGSDSLRSTLVVLDLATLTVKYEVWMPDRAYATVYFPGMTLTENERYLFYAAVVSPRNRCTAADMAGAPAGTDGHCDRTFVGTIDLGSAEPAAILAPIPKVNCGFGRPSPVIGTIGYLTCVDGATFAIDARQPSVATEILSSVGRPNEIDPGLSHNLANIVARVRGDDGLPGYLFSSGRFRMYDAAGDYQEYAALPDGRSLWYLGVLPAGDRLVLVHRSRQEQVLTGVAVFNWRTGRIERDIALDPSIAATLADDSTLLTILEDGSFERVNLVSGAREVLGGRVSIAYAAAAFLN